MPSVCCVVLCAQIFTGYPIADYFAANPQHLKGVNLFVPQDATFPSNESILFFTQIGKVRFSKPVVCMWSNGTAANAYAIAASSAQINFTGSVSNMNVVRAASPDSPNTPSKVIELSLNRGYGILLTSL